MTHHRKQSSLRSVGEAADREKNGHEAVIPFAPSFSTPELQARFIHALERGETQGDILVVDADGNEVKQASSHLTIFDIK